MTNFSDSGIEDERDPDKKDSKDETKLESDENPIEESGKNIDDGEEEPEEEKCLLCPCWSFCPGIGLLPPEAPDKCSLIGTIKLIASWVTF